MRTSPHFGDCLINIAWVEFKHATYNDKLVIAILQKIFNVYFILESHLKIDMSNAVRGGSQE